MANRSVQEIFNEAYGTSFNSVEQILNAVHDAGYRPAHTLTVALSGGDYTSIGAAITAALAAGATVAAKWTVRGCVGVSRNYTPNEAVDVVFEDDLAFSGNRDRGLVPICGPTPDHFVTPYKGGLVSLIIDDGGNDITTADAGGCTGTTPAAYLQSLGIPIGLAPTPPNVGGTQGIGTPYYLTVAQLRSLIIDSGFELCSHSYLHASLAGYTPDQIWKEVAGSRKYLDDLEDMTFCFGFDSLSSALNKKIQFISDSASDTQVATVVGIAHSGTTRVTRTVTLTGTSAADLYAADPTTTWDYIHSVSLSSPAVGTITVRDSSSNTIVTFTAGQQVKASSQSIGNVVRGMVQPGGWVLENNFDQTRKLSNEVMQYIRANYEWFTGYLTPYVNAAKSRFGVGRFALSSVTAEVAKTLASPGMRSILSCHASGNAGGTALPTNFKTLIDYLVVERNLGRLEFVSPSTIFDALQVLQPAGTDLSALRGYTDGIQHGDFDFMTASPYTTGTTYCGWYMSIGTAGAITLETVSGSNKALQISRGTAAVYAKTSTYVKPGRRYRLKFDAIKVHENANMQVQIKQAGVYEGTVYIAIDALAPDSWTTYERCFTAHKDCTGQVSILFYSTVNSTGYQIDNVSCVQC
jgi:hypothetical protein